MLGNRLKEYREAKGESVRELAAIVGMDATQLSKLERGLRGCGDEFKLKLAQHFGVGVETLFFQQEVGTTSTEVPA